jgi:hypothetical protein
MGSLDLNRGVMTKFHPQNGMKISQYIDSPGVYYTDTAEPVPPELARQAGFNVEKDMRNKLKNERLAAAKRQIEAEMRQEEDAIAEALSGKSGFDVRHIGGGQYALFGKDGKKLTRVAMTKADAELLLGRTVEADANDPSAAATPQTADLGALLGAPVAS